MTSLPDVLTNPRPEPLYTRDEIFQQPLLWKTTLTRFQDVSKRLNFPNVLKGARVAARVNDRIVVLASSPLHGWSAEAGLKVLEMAGGRFPVITETYLGLRHGPMSFVRPDSLVVCLLSSDPLRRMYELDLIRELRSKMLGCLVGITNSERHDVSFDEIIPAIVPKAPDALRTPFEIIIPQLLGYRLSLKAGLNPDNPSPNGVINRVVQGFSIYSTDPASSRI